MVAEWVTAIILIILGFGLTVGFLIFRFFIFKYTEQVKVRPDATIIRITARKQFTNGYVEGLVKSDILCKNNCYRIEFYPIDAEQGEGIAKPKLQTVIIHKDMLKRYSKGEDSSRREIITDLPRTLYDLPEKMRETKQGQDLSVEGQLGHIIKTFGKAISQGDEAIAEAQTEYARGQITRNALSAMKEKNAELQNAQFMNANQENKDKTKN